MFLMLHDRTSEPLVLAHFVSVMPLGPCSCNRCSTLNSMKLVSNPFCLGCVIPMLIVSVSICLLLVFVPVND